MTVDYALQWILSHDCMLSNDLPNGVVVLYTNRWRTTYYSQNPDKGMALIEVVSEAVKHE